MATNEYRPKVGDMIFMAFMDEQPFLATVMGYHSDKRFSSEQIEYRRQSGRESTNSLSNLTFYPEAPTDTSFVYVVQVEESEFMDKSEHTDLGYFFDPQSAFDHLEGIKAGTITPRHRPTAEFVEFSVRVERA
jgi:hypothetical protein